MKLENGQTVYFAELSMACGHAGTDYADIVVANDEEEATKLAYEQVCEFIEMFVPIMTGDEEELAEMDEEGDAYILACDVDSPTLTPYNPELHDMYRSGGGSFMDDIKRYM